MTKQLKQAKINDLVSEAIDAEIVRENLEQGIPEEITRQQIEESRKMIERYDCLLIAGYTEEQIDALWENKTPQEILAMPSANGHVSQ